MLKYHFFVIQYKNILIFNYLLLCLTERINRTTTIQFNNSILPHTI